MRHQIMERTKCGLIPRIHCPHSEAAKPAQDALAHKLAAARELLPTVAISLELRRAIARVCGHLKVGRWVWRSSYLLVHTSCFTLSRKHPYSLPQSSCRDGRWRMCG